jgi:hypothetical protein
MRLRACIGGLLLAATGCTQLPERVRIHVGERVIELRQPGMWSTSPDCNARAPRVDPAEAGTSMVLVKPDHLQITGADGRVWSFYRCVA